MESQAVAVHEIANILFPQKNVWKVRIVRDEESESVPVGLKPSFDYFSPGRKTVAAPVELHELSFLDQRPEGLAQFFAPVGRNV
jgi:hypothetical protein